MATEPPKRSQFSRLRRKAPDPIAISDDEFPGPSKGAPLQSEFPTDPNFADVAIEAFREDSGSHHSLVPLEGKYGFRASKPDLDDPDLIIYHTDGHTTPIRPKSPMRPKSALRSRTPRHSPPAAVHASFTMKSGPTTPLVPQTPQERKSEASLEVVHTHKHAVTAVTSDKEIEQRQKFIDRLMYELDNKSSAIQVLGKDIVRLRDQTQAQAQEIARLSTQLGESEISTKRLVSGFDLEALDSPELRRRYAILAGKLEKTLEKVHRLEGDVYELQNENEKKAKIEKEMKQLSMAHFAQQALVMSLQEAVASSGKFKTVIKKQEIVIKRLEEQLSGSNAPVPRPKTPVKEPTPTEPHYILESSQSKLYKLLIKENRDLKQRLSHAEANPLHSKDVGAIGTDKIVLLTNLVVKRLAFANESRKSGD
jgi:hypothetical protein